jgi:hypothetical protein
VRAFGWFHPSARRRLNRVRALLHQSPVLTPKEQTAWLENPPSAPSVWASIESPPLRQAPDCRHCQRPMVFIARVRPNTRTANRFIHQKPP